MAHINKLKSELSRVQLSYYDNVGCFFNCFQFCVILSSSVMNYYIAIIKWHEYIAIMNNAWASRAVIKNPNISSAE